MTPKPPASLAEAHQARFRKARAHFRELEEQAGQRRSDHRMTPPIDPPPYGLEKTVLAWTIIGAWVAVFVSLLLYGAGVLKP